MRMLVTGGNGFIGSHYIRYWLGRYPGDSIINLDLRTFAGDRTSLADVEERHGEGYLLKQGDIADHDLVDDLVATGRPEVVANFAAESTTAERSMVLHGSCERTSRERWADGALLRHKRRVQPRAPVASRRRRRQDRAGRSGLGYDRNST